MLRVRVPKSGKKQHRATYRPVKIKKGRKRPVNTPFELQLCGKHAAAFMSLIQSARMNGHDPYAYLKDVLTRLPTQKASEIEQLLPHQWIPG
jgi:hypothetical protein